MRTGNAGADGAFLAAGDVLAVAVPVIDVLRALQLVDLDGQRRGTQALLVGCAHGLLGDFRRVAGLRAVVEHDHGAVLLEVLEGGRSEGHCVPLLLSAAEVDDFRMAVAAAVRVGGQIRAQIQFLQAEQVGKRVLVKLRNALHVQIHKAVGKIGVGDFLDALGQNQLAQAAALGEHTVQLGEVLGQAHVGHTGARGEYVIGISRVGRIRRVLKVDAGDAGTAVERILAEGGNGGGQIQAALHVGALTEGLIADGLQARREGDHGQRGAAIKRGVADFLEVLRQVDTGQIGAAVKGLIADLHEGIRQRNLLQPLLIPEGPVSDLGHAVLDGQLFLVDGQHEGDGVVAIDDAVHAAEGAALGKVDALQRRAAAECR